MQQGVVKNIVPYEDSKLSKKEQVAQMFDHIAPRYDFLNHFLSMGIDRSWRRKALRILEQDHPQKMLDIATGTGDLAIMAARMLHPKHITGIDISQKMLQLGEKKVQQEDLDHIIDLKLADSEALPFDTATFDAVTSAFGVRNFEHLEKGLAEMLRVLRPGGQAVILEFSKPTLFPFKQFFNLYFRYITPYIGKWVADNKEAYSYLPESVKAFPQGQDMIDILIKTGFQKAACQPLTIGICSIYSAVK